uniref:RAB3A interacting protein n=1 Tax=Propithecus coquereli TaxID=379532 RepID=A0A2K6EM30_PROCO
RKLSYDEAFAMANDPLEGFHEVNLASPTSPDLLGVYESGTQEQNTSPSVIYRPHPSALCSTPIQANALDVSELPTQPVYSSPRRLNCAEISGISIHVTDPAPCSTSGVTAGEFLQGATVTEACDGNDDIFGLSTDSLSRLRSPSVLEVREKGYERLKEELAKAQRVRKRDILFFHISLLKINAKYFEAHKMVREANIKQATAEKQLKEAQGKVKSPEISPRLYGQLLFDKGVKSTQWGKNSLLNKCADLSLYNEFRSWKDEPTMDRTCPFLDKIYQEDIFPCLTFSKSEVIFFHFNRNALYKSCKHRIKLGDSSNYYYISPFCRYRITSVCNFFTYIRYIQQGLVKQQDVDQMFWEVMQLRKEMSLAKLGYFKEEL